MKLSLTSIQNLPLETRVRIMWGLIVIVAMGLVVIWGYSTRRQVREISQLNVQTNPSTNESIAAENKYTTVEWVTRTNGKLLVYFKAYNTSNNILNFSKPDLLTITVDGKSQPAKSITDRQGSPFVQKILSQTQNFGVAEFEDKPGNKAQIKFDGLFFENDSSNKFYETIDLDLKNLTKDLNSK